MYSLSSSTYWKLCVLAFLAVLIGFAACQWLWSRSTEPYDEREIQMPENKEFTESVTMAEQTPWQKYRTRKRLGLEGPASPGSMLIIDILQSLKPQKNTEHVGDAKPIE